MADVILTGSRIPVDLGFGVTLVAHGLTGTAAVQGAGARAGDGPIADGGVERRGRAAGLAPEPESPGAASGAGPIAVTPGISDALARAGYTARPTVAINQSAPAGHDVVLTAPAPPQRQGVVLLVQDDAGGLSWHLPTPAGPDRKPAMQRSLVGTGQTPGPVVSKVQFTIPRERFGMMPQSPGRANTPAGARPMLNLGVLTKRVLAIFDYPLAAVGHGAAAIFGAWERHARPTRVFTFPVAAGTRPQEVTDAAWQALSGVPALFLVHGVFSTCESGFASIDSDTWVKLEAQYPGRIVAFDHPTASVGVVDNIKELLATIPDDVTLTLDIVAHSRGGLVARMLAGQGKAGDFTQDELAKLANITVRKIIFAGTPNAGTAITLPAHWTALINRFTTLINVLPGSIEVAGDVLDALLELLKGLGQGAIDGLPGVNEMQPDSSVYADLNAYGGEPPEYYAISVNFNPPALLRSVFSAKTDAEEVADALVDAVFDQQDNDVAVPTVGVGDPVAAEAAAPAARAGARPPVMPGFPVDDLHRLSFGDSDTVWHCSYFAQPQTWAKLVEWLQ